MSSGPVRGLHDTASGGGAQLPTAVPPENLEAIVAARQHVERVMLEAHEDLGRRSAELAQSLAMMRATLESASDGIYVTDARAMASGYNEKFLRMWDLTEDLMDPKEHERLKAASARHFADPAAFFARIRDIIITAPAESLDLLETLDGRVIERTSKIQWVGERNVGRVWCFRDMTQQRRAERELREQGERLRVTLASIGDAVITVDTACRVTSLNPVAEDLTGWPGSDAMGHHVEEVMKIVHETTRELVENPIRRALVEGVVVGLKEQTTLIRRDGTGLPIETRAAPIKDDAGSIIGVVMVFHDVTERRQRELTLQRSYRAEQEARASAEKADRAKDNFIAALSHELRTPLTPVLAILSDLHRHGPIPQALADDLETMRRNVELETRLIDDLLDLTRITRGKLHLHLAHISAAPVIEDAVNTCLPDLKAKNLTLQRDLVEPAPTLTADGARLTQILWNLLNNATKFTPPGGRIHVRSRLERTPEALQLIIEVQDTGIGMDPARLERIFKAFEQGDGGITRQFGGLGLGLAISEAIAQAHHGTLRGHSEGEGLGSTFTLTLPCAESSGSRTDGASPTGDAGCQDHAHSSLNTNSSTPVSPRLERTPVTPSLQVRPLRILLVDDHADTLHIISRLLRGMGHHVVTADCVQRALDTAHQEMTTVGLDLLMCDIGLPDGTGHDVMRALAARSPLPGIALSGYGMEADMEESAAAGFARHIVKPIDINLLKSAMAELMGV